MADGMNDLLGDHLGTPEPEAASTLGRRAMDAGIWDRDPHDWYIEERFAVELLFDAVKFRDEVWDPACGIGTIPGVALERRHFVYGSDLIDRMPGEKRPYRFEVSDFLDGAGFMPPVGSRLNIISNPPFKHAIPFIERALTLADHRVAMLLPLKFLASQRRKPLFESTPVEQVLILSRRPSMPPGAVLQAGVKPGGGKEDFCWIVWHRDATGRPEIRWIA